jgi:hypothetical protein
VNKFGQLVKYGKFCATSPWEIEELSILNRSQYFFFSWSSKVLYRDHKYSPLNPSSGTSTFTLSHAICLRSNSHLFQTDDS